jgi:hypothetical protein
VDLAYLAGFFDGEGCIGLYTTNRGRGSVRLAVQIFQNHGRAQDELMQEIQARWGGTLHDRGTGFLYHANGERGIQMLTDLRPHLRIKAEQADVALDWYATRAAERFKPRSDAQVAADAAAAQLLRQLKKGT